MVVPATRSASSTAVASRRTSGLETRTATIRAPVTARSRSRAIVSVSGSSGTARSGRARELAPADVRAELLPLELDASRVSRAELLRFVHGWRDPGDCQYAAAAGNELTVRRALGAGMEDQYVGRRWRELDT